MNNNKVFIAGLICIFIFIFNKNVYAENNDNIIIDNSEVEKIIDEVCIERQVPSEIVKAIAYKESKMQQWYTDGSPVLSYNGNYVGIMQVSVNAGYDYNKLKNDIYYNLNAGIDILFLKWNMSVNNYSVPRFENMDQMIIENWYFAIWAYNGWLSRNNPNSNSKAYQESVLDIASEKYGAEISDIDRSLLPSTGLPEKRLILPNGDNEHTSTSFIPVNPFEDIEGNWAEDIIFDLYQKEIIKGVTPDYFMPDANMRVDEFCTLFSRYVDLGIADNYENRFENNIDDWAEKEIASLDSYDLIGMYENSADLSMEITRGQVAEILANYIIRFDTAGKYTNTDDVILIFEDLPVTLMEEDLHKIKILYKANIITGRDSENGIKEYAYDEKITRAEVTAVIWKMMKSIIID